jgi:hypothetical protein
MTARLPLAPAFEEVADGLPIVAGSLPKAATLA